MELDSHTEKLYHQILGDFCNKTINFSDSVTLTSHLIVDVDELTQYEYKFSHKIDRSEVSAYKDRYVSQSTQTDVHGSAGVVQGTQTDIQGSPGVVQTDTGDIEQNFPELISIKEELYEDADHEDYGSDTEDENDNNTIPNPLFDSFFIPGTRGKITCPFCPTQFSRRLAAERHFQKKHDVTNVFGIEFEQPANVDNADDKINVTKRGRRKNSEPKKINAKKTKSSLSKKNDLSDSEWSENNENTEKEVKKNFTKRPKKKSKAGTKLKKIKKEKGSDVELDDKSLVPKIKIADESFVPESKSSEQVKCIDCGKLYFSLRSLRRHYSTVHSDQVYECNLCDKKFNGKETLYHHKRGIHMDIKPYKCTEEGCDASFSFSHSLRLHALKHSGSRPHMCPNCGKTYLTAYHLKVHVQATHSDRKQFTCKTCGKSFSYSTSLKMHEATHESQLRVSCDQCTKTFVNGQALKYHMMSKHSKEGGYFPCNQCDKVYTAEFLLRGHKRRHTTAANRFMCTTCGHQFMYKSALEMHEAVHKDEKLFKCKICDKSFKTYPTLYSHQYVHKQDSPFTCTKCGKAFKTNERCKAHERRHSGLKPFECSICQHCFPDKGGLSKHMKTVHCSVKKFVCDICGKATTRADNLRVHMKVHAKGEPCDKNVEYTMNSAGAESNASETKSSTSTKTSRKIKHFRPLNPDMYPTMVPLTFNPDPNDARRIQTKSKAINETGGALFIDEDSCESLMSNTNPDMDNRGSELQSNVPHFATIDSSQISPSQNEDQTMPLNLQNHPNLHQLSSLQRQSLPTTTQTSSSGNTVPTSATPGGISVANLPTQLIYPFTYVYPSNGLYQQ